MSSAVPAKAVLITNFQKKIIAPPLTIPAIAPTLFVLLIKRAQRMIGPNAAPKPAHANETILKTELPGSLARKIAITEITTTEILARTIDFFAESLTLKVSCTRFCEILEAAFDQLVDLSSYAVDIVEARIPARIMPPVKAGT